MRHSGLVAAALLLAVSGCGQDSSPAETAATPSHEQLDAFDPARFATLWHDAEQGALDYQLGGAYDPAPGATVVVRDREAVPADVLIDICYVNAFQTQPGALDWWLAEHPELLLRDVDGEPVVDPGWPDERILDTSTDSSRAAIVSIVGAWIDGCAAAGFEAIEFDNLDAWTRTDTLDGDGALALATALVDRAHAAGLAAAQKNALEAGAAGPAAGFDLVISEECARFEECGNYASLYARHLAVEYADALPAGESFAAVCARADQPALTVLRDHDLTTPEDPAHVMERC